LTEAKGAVQFSCGGPNWRRTRFKLVIIDQRIAMQPALFTPYRFACGRQPASRVLRSRTQIWGNDYDQRKTMQEIRYRVQVTRVIA